MPVQQGDTCKRGHVIDGDNVQHYMNRGAAHIRCKLCNQPPRVKATVRGDKCPQGHVIDGHNYAEKKVGGRIAVYCRRCGRDANRRYLNKQSGGRRESKDSLVNAQKAADRADELIKSGKDENALNYLRLTKRAERAAVALQNAMDKHGSNCKDNPGPYTDYDEDNPPSPIEAYHLCQGCPILLDCARFASAYAPPIGVWGGEVYLDGKPVMNEGGK